MKRFALYLGVFVGLVASCSTKENDFVAPSQDDMVFYASFEKPAEDDTRVYANEDLLLRWTADDRVSIFNKITYNQEYKFTGQTGANAGGFKKVDNDEFVTGNTISHVVSVYPFQESTVISEREEISFLLPSEQHYAEKTFGLGDNTMVSVSEDNVLQYKNVGGYLMLKLYGDGVSVSSITLKGNNGEKLAGKATVTMPLNGAPSTTMANDATTSITLTCETPVQLGATAEENTQFWFVVPPVTLNKGFTITVYESTGGIFEKSTSKSIAIERNKLSKMMAMEVEKSTPIGNIVFADPAAKYACLAKYDTNRDGEVSYEEAEAVTTFSGLFDDWKGVTSFDEIRYFKNVHSLSGVFEGCNKLVSITIPENITELGTYAFNGCSALTSVDLPSGITAIGNYTFQNCSSLVSVDIPSDVVSIGLYAFSRCSSLKDIVLPSVVSSIGNYAFQNCSALTSIDLPPALKTIGQYAFSGCSSLTQIAIPDGVTSLGSNAFRDCSKLATVNIPSGVTSIPAYCFWYCFSLTSVTVPEGITSIDSYAFHNVNMWKLALPSTVTSLGNTCFGNIVCIILPSTSPVSIQSNTFNGVKGVFVPSNLIEMYGAMTNWANYSTKLHPISIYREKNEFTLATNGAVDMGTSVKWAAYNVGATKPEDYGDYFAWGDTQTKTNYSWSSYKWCNGAFNKLTKYCPTDRIDYWGGSGTPDGKTCLDLEDDAARVNWGGRWRMPTESECEALIEDCYWELTTYQGIDGYEIYGFKDGKKLFLPMANRWDDSYLDDSGACYWSSSLCVSDFPYPDHAYSMCGQGLVFGTYYSRSAGLPVRPVCE